MRCLRTAVLAVVLVASSVLAAGIASAGPGGSIEAERAQFLAYLNQLRASQGLPALQVDPELTALAQEWANGIAAARQMVHPDNPGAYVSTPWLRLGENVAYGSTTEITWQGLVDSQAHYQNMVDPGFTHVGIGVAWVDGVQYVTQRFMEAAPAGAFEPPPAEAPALPPPPPVELPAPVEEPTQVLAESLERSAVNVAVIPPIRYGELAASIAPATDTGDDGGPPIALLIVIAAAAVLLAGAATWAARSRRARAG